MKRILLIVTGLVLLISCWEIKSQPFSYPVLDSVKQKAVLDKILSLLPPDRTIQGRVSFLDETFKDWLKRTGELPPDFDQMPSIPFLPDPLILNEGGENKPVKTMAHWKDKRAWMKEKLGYYITGTYPPAPDNLEWKVINEKMDGGTLVRLVELSFGPEKRATLTIELMVPPLKGPLPVFITQWDHREWALIAVRRGYIGCVYAGSDSKDDTEKYSEIWAGQYDFTRLMRRAYGASRAIDYLYTIPDVDREKIAISGHSRNGKLSLIAAAFDERITACIPSSGGSGAEVPWRYNSINYDIEDIALLACAQPAWLHPRIRFFIGRENKLPVDQNLFMALIAPRGLMLSTSIVEGASNPWGIEEAYHVTKKVYDFLGKGENLAIRSRYGLHDISARDMEDYMDFFDYIFKRTDHKPGNKLFYDYSFNKWQELSREAADPMDYKIKGIEDIDIDAQNNRITSVLQWEQKKHDIQKNICWGLGDEPPGVINPGPRGMEKKGRGENIFGTFLTRPGATKKMGVMPVSPFYGFGDQLFGYLYYPVDENGDFTKAEFPVVIYLHEYDYSKGFNSYHRIEQFFESVVDRGCAVFSYDMIGFGNRIEEGTRFYNRYPHWSKMGKMVTDVIAAVEALGNLNFIDSSSIYVAGYSLGATVGLYAAAIDKRIAGVASVAGFTPMRLNTQERGTEGIKAFSHLHGLIPRLGFFTGHESRVPYDFHEIIACIAPRPVLLIAPVLDKDAHINDIIKCVEESSKIYDLYGSPGNIKLYKPDDYNRFSDEMRGIIYEWITENKINGEKIKEKR